MRTDADGLSYNALPAVIIDDHDDFSRRLERLINTEGSPLRIVGRTDDPGSAVELLQRTRPRLAILELTMPPPGGIDAIRCVKDHDPKIKVLALSRSDSADLAVGALLAGADGFLPKPSEPDRLILPLLSLAHGSCVLPHGVLRALLEPGERPGRTILSNLSDEERRLWLLVARGLDTAELAQQLFTSERTVKRLVAALLRRIGAANRLDAAGLAGRVGLLDER